MASHIVLADHLMCSRNDRPVETLLRVVYVGICSDVQRGEGRLKTRRRHVLCKRLEAVEGRIDGRMWFMKIEDSKQGAGCRPSKAS